MFDSKDLQTLMKQLEGEILALKTAKKAGLLLQVNDFVLENYNLRRGIHKIIYAAGTQPIITVDYSGTGNNLFSPSGNEQYFTVEALYASATLHFISTRKITGVEFVSE